MFPLVPGRLGAAAALAIPLFFFLAGPAPAAEPLGLREAQALAAARSQQLAAGDAAAEAARQMAVAAAQLPDPVLRLGVENLPLSGPERLSLSRDGMTMRRIALMQEWPSETKRRLRAERFEREAERSAAERRLDLAALQRDTALAWLERHYAQRTGELLQRQLQETRLQAEGAQAAVAGRRGSPADWFAARAAQGQLLDRLSQVERQAANAALMLARWIGEAAERPLAGPPDWRRSRWEPGRLEAQQRELPDLAVLQAQLEQARAEAALAEANRRPDWSFEASYNQRGSAYADMLSFGVAIPLPWDRGQRQDRELAARLAGVEAARARHEERRRSVDAELRSLHNEWQSGLARLARYENELLPLARQRGEAALAAYRAGQADLASALAARRDELDTQMQALSLELDTARAWARLDYLIPDPAAGAPRQEQP